MRRHVRALEHLRKPSERADDAFHDLECRGGALIPRLCQTLVVGISRHAGIVPIAATIHAIAVHAATVAVSASVHASAHASAIHTTEARIWGGVRRGVRTGAEARLIGVIRGGLIDDRI